VALEPDQLALMHRRQRLGDLGLADAGLALEQQRPLEEIHEPQRRRQVVVGDVADGAEALGDAVTLGDHPSSPGCEPGDIRSKPQRTLSSVMADLRPCGWAKSGDRMLVLDAAGSSCPAL